MCLAQCLARRKYAINGTDGDNEEGGRGKGNTLTLGETENILDYDCLANCRFLVFCFAGLFWLSFSCLKGKVLRFLE